MSLKADAGAKARRAVKIARNAVRDLRYGGLLGGTIKTPYEHLGAFDTANSDYDDLPALFAAATVRPGDVIVDAGCGKGRVINWVLGQFPQNDVYGIELDPEVAAKTATRLRRYPRVRILCGDAPALLPDEATILYLFNPFDENVMQRFAARVLEHDASGDGRERRIVYCRCKFLGPFEQSDRFAIQRIELPSKRHEAVLITVKPGPPPARGEE